MSEIWDSVFLSLIFFLFSIITLYTTKTNLFLENYYIGLGGSEILIFHLFFLLLPIFILIIYFYFSGKKIKIVDKDEKTEEKETPFPHVYLNNDLTNPKNPPFFSGSE